MTATATEHDIRKHIVIARNCIWLPSQYLTLFHLSLSTKLRLYRVFILFLSLSMQQKHGLPLNNYRGTSTHLTSGVCIAHNDTTNFLKGPHLKRRGLQTYRPATTHTHHPYHTSQVLWPHRTC